MSDCPYIQYITAENTLNAYKRLNYTIFMEGDYNINIFGIRTNNRQCDLFNDVIGLLYKVDNKWVIKTFTATTDPGFKSLEQPINPCGCAILVPGQYPGAFKIGFHKGKYKALVQNRPVKLYRDNNCDTTLDFINAKCEMAGINIHHANTDPEHPSKLVQNWSAGCQVIKSITDWNEFMTIIHKSSTMYGDIFSYTLFTENEYFGK